MKRCQICGKEMEKFLYSDIEGNVWCSDQCYEKAFWNRCLDQDAIIINGRCYHDGGNGLSVNGFKGFDGSLYIIKNLKTGHVWETDNLWYNGEIPDNLRSEFPDTHEFVKNRPTTDLLGGDI